MEKTFTIRISESLLDAFKAKALSTGSNPSLVARLLISKYLREEIKIEL